MEELVNRWSVVSSLYVLMQFRVKILHMECIINVWNKLFDMNINQMILIIWKPLIYKWKKSCIFI